MFPSGIQWFSRNFSMLPTCHCPGLSVFSLPGIPKIVIYSLQYCLSFYCLFYFYVLCTPLFSPTSLNIFVSLTLWLLLSLLFRVPCSHLSLCLPRKGDNCVSLTFLLSLFSSSPCLSHPPRPMFPSGDPLLIHHYFHGYLAGFTVRPGSLESREVIECLYACREGLDYSDFDSLGKGMKVCPSAQLAWVSSTLLPGLASQDFACSPTSDSSPPFSFVSLIAWVLGICQGMLSIFFSSASRFM